MREQLPTSTTRPPFSHLILYGLIAGLIIGISALAVFLLIDRFSSRGKSENAQIQDITADFDGTIAIDPPIAVPDIKLANSDNELAGLSDWRGQFVLLTFGFTHCPDVCPLTLSEFQRIQSQLGRLADEVQFVFVSVDGARDSPAVLREYFSFRGYDEIIALTGSEEVIRALGAPLGLAFEVGEELTRGGYLVNHTAGSFLLDRNGSWITRYQFGVPPATIVADLRRLLQA
ncbi:MAG: SCO family protein [Chloroflexi bacterium]|nr:SCO family protein [Chloroflexota bacterium]